MLPISVSIIACNEADRISGAIESLPDASEVVVVDSGSTDNTVDVARSLGARVIETDWPGHIRQKNRALQMCQQEWVLFLDADERLNAELVSAVHQAITRENGPVAYRMRRRNCYLGIPIKAGSFGPQWHIRLARREVAVWGGEDPHDRLMVTGVVGKLPGHIEHNPYRHFSEHLETMEAYSARFVEVSLEKGRRARLVDVLFRPPWHFFRSMVIQAGWRDGVVGVLLAWLASAYVALKWTRLWLAKSMAER